MASTTWSLCLVVSSLPPGSNRKVVKVNPSSDTIEDLFRIAKEAYGVDSVESLKTGFPPQSLTANDATLLANSKSVGNQERVQVVIDKAPTGAKNNKAKGKVGRTKNDSKSNTPAATENSGQSPTKRRPKRAAAQAATNSFADVIRQQDKMMKEEMKPQSKKSKRGGSAISKGSSANKPTKRAKTPVFTSKEPGRRLGDGAVVGTSKSKSATSPPTRRTKTARQELRADRKKHEDMSTALLEAFNQSGSGGKVLRKTMKNALENSYESTKASARLAALESRNPRASVKMERIDNVKLHIKFQKVKGHGRGFYEEVVDWIPTEVLAEVLKAILKSNEENLLPENLALLSPRFLWALAFRHWEEQEQKQKGQDSPSPWEPFSIEEVYRRMVPDKKDWAFLRGRKRNLSEKAKENLRQQQESDGDGYEMAAEAVQDVELAMGTLQKYGRAQKAGRVANAALARQLRRQQSSAGEDAWEIVTPPEHDEDELTECFAASETPLEKPKASTTIARLLAKSGSARNWRELANLAPSILHAQLVDKEESLGYITELQVSQWVDHARLQSLEEIMVEICGSISNVEVLRDNSPVNTPKDLAAWKAMPDLLMDEIGDAASTGFTVADLARFCDRASRTLEQFEWLNWYVTSIA